MSNRAHFTPALFDFLRGLAKNNSREWFTSKKDEYEGQVKEPMLRFITDLKPRLAKISSHLEVEPKVVGGSLQRMNRDTRFSKDKNPYKTNVGAMFGHGNCGDLKLGFHLTLAPTQKGFGGIKAYAGIWDPDGAALDKIRTRILVKPEEWTKAVGGAFAKSHVFEGESLKRPPTVGDCAVAPDHPLVVDLKRKSHAASVSFDEKSACSPTFLDQYVESARTGAPLMTFLCKALAVPF